MAHLVLFIDDFEVFIVHFCSIEAIVVVLAKINSEKFAVVHI